jgi:AbrB family transcriptional regulator (stage V sporulation protein T)
MKVGPKGQVVIPQELRERLGIRPGQEVIVEASGDAALVRRLASTEELLGLLADGASTAELEAERRRERNAEERRAGEAER